MWKRGGRRFLSRIFGGGSSGATLIEMVIAVVVLGLMSASIPPVMVLMADSGFRQNELRIAQDLTRSQFEYIKAQDYRWGNETEIDPGSGCHKRVVYDLLDMSGPLGSYGIRVLAWPIDPVTHVRFCDISQEDCCNGRDEGVQEVEITVFGWRLDPEGDVKYILMTTNYKVDRSLEIQGYEVIH